MAACFAVGCFFWVMRSISIIKSQFLAALVKGWGAKAQEYFEKCSYDDLIGYCERRIKERPNDVHALWWLARALKEKGKNTEAEEIFKKVVKIEPSWEEEFVKPYVSNASAETPANH